jgi:disulfide bond formation protein DsbB
LIASLVTRAGHDRLLILALLGCAGLLGGAFFFQHVMGLAPCPLCIWQRWPHAVAIALIAVALLRPGLATIATGLAAISLLVGAGIAGYHVGVEQGFWTSATCGTPEIGAGSAADLLARLREAPMVACDEVVWSFAGVSMAGWNGIASVGLVGVLWLALGERRPRRA